MFRCRACWTCFMRKEQVPTHDREICNDCHSQNKKNVYEDPEFIKTVNQLPENQRLFVWWLLSL